MTDTGSNLESFLPKPWILTQWSRRLGPFPALHAATVIADDTLGGFVSRYLGAQTLWGAAPSPRLSFEIRCALGSFYDGCGQGSVERCMRARVLSFLTDARNSSLRNGCAQGWAYLPDAQPTWRMCTTPSTKQCATHLWNEMLFWRCNFELSPLRLQQQCLWNWEFWSGFQTVIWSCFLLSSEPFWSGFQTETDTGFVPVCVKICDICVDNKMSPFRMGDLCHTLRIFCSFCSETEFVAFWSQISQMV